MKFYSHPDKLLIDHLSEVKTLCLKQLDEEYKKAGEIISICHDFGKYTTYFQNYLFGKKKEKSSLSNHGFISAIFAAYTAFLFFDEEEYLPYIIFNVVLHHHGSLENPSEDLPEKFTGITGSDSSNLVTKVDAAKLQIEDIKRNRNDIEKDYKSLGFDKYFNMFLDDADIEELLLKIKKIDFEFNRFNKDEKIYFVHQMLYSALISADKISASNTVMPEESYADYNTLNNIKENNFKNCSKNNINSIRSQIFKDIQSELNKNYKKSKMFSITSPTGTGKTYSGFFAALKLKELLGENRRIIYSLPFTSIIDQNYKSIYYLLEGMKDFKEKSSTYIIKHHNLSNVDYTDYKKEYSKLQAEMLIENWTSGIVVTTFVQLLQTLIGNRNKMLKKFDSIRGAIILLDEVQAIDIKLYNAVDFILRGAVKYLDCRIIMMTATKPLILSDAHELLPDNKKYFASFKRTALCPSFVKERAEEFAERFIENIENKSYLIICNTIKSSLDIYEKLKHCNREVYYLSTNLLPKHRRERINTISEKLKNGEKIILVSTQVVEAGVDLDFDEAYRDIAPLDSIIQSAGRCNRNGANKDRGKVHVLSLVNDKGQYCAYSVYGKTLINISKDILEKHKEIPEEDYYELISEYFKEVNKNINDEVSEGFIESIKKLYFSKSHIEECSLNKFSLIKENPDYIDIFLRADEEGEELYQKLMKSISEKDLKKKREMYLDIKNSVRDYTLSIPMKYKGKANLDDIIPNIPMEGCEDYYDAETGFVREDKEDYLIF